MPSLTDTPSRDPFLTATVGLGVLWVLALPWSIAVAEASMWLAAAVGGVAWVRREIGGSPLPLVPDRPGPAGDLVGLVGTPVIGFWAVSLLAALFSRDRMESLWELREVFLFVAPLVVFVAFWEPARRRTGRLAFAAGMAIAVGTGVVQTAMAISRGEPVGVFRPDGPLGHYMTYAGLLMLGIPLLLTVARPLALWVAARLLAALALGVIGLTMTRSAWLGVAATLVVWAVSGRVSGAGGASTAARQSPVVKVMTVVVAVTIVALLLVSLAGHGVLAERGASIFSLDNETNVDRLAMAVTGLRLIAHHPFLGVGPGLVGRIYPAWRVPWAVKEQNSHLHNNLLQVAAERGLVGLTLWLWMMAAFVVGAWRVLRHSGPAGLGGPEARAALAALAGFLTMGLFEYNFSDSEVLMVLLYVVSLPFAASAGLPTSLDDPGQPDNGA